MQKELTARGPLLNEKGELHEAGYARQLVKQYDRRAIKPEAAAIRAVNEALEAEFEKVRLLLNLLKEDIVL